jgi:hypothetical protein
VRLHAVEEIGMTLVLAGVALCSLLGAFSLVGLHVGANPFRDRR